MPRIWILVGLLLVTHCGGDAGTGTQVGDETGGADRAGPEPGMTAPNNDGAGIATGTPAGETSPDPEPLPESEGHTTPDPDPDMMPTEPMPTDPDMSQTDPDPNMMGETDPDPETDAEPDPDAPVALSFAADIWPVWSAVRDPVFVYRGTGSYSACTDVGVCHGGENPGARLSMADSQTAYAQMMDTPSVSGLCAGTQRVVIGDPDSSCLVLFYEGRLGQQDLDWVDDAEIELMREWIRQGALP